MSETTSGPALGLTKAQEEAAFYHEAALNTTWTGTRFLIGVVSSALGAFIFAFFYLRSLNSHGMWYPGGSAATKPSVSLGTAIMLLTVISALALTYGLQQVKAGKRNVWLMAAIGAIVLGVVAAVLEMVQLATLGFLPGGSGFASVFVGATPVLVLLVLGTMFWLENLVMQVRRIPEISFVEQPATFGEAAVVQRLQASMSACTLFWNFVAIAAIVMWILFYLVH